MINKIEDNNFAPIEAAKVSLLDFNAVWCGPCRMLGPVVEELSDEYDGQVEFFSVDADDNAALCAQFGVMNIPALFICKNGKPVASRVGFAPKAQLDAWIKANL